MSVGINSQNNIVSWAGALSGTQTWGPYVRTGMTAGTSYTIQYTRHSGHTQMNKFATLSPTSYLCFDIPEGEEHDPSNITFGGSTPGTSDYGGLGLQIHKMGKGKLLMSTVKSDIGGKGITSMVVEEGLVKKSSGATCGAQYSRIVVEDGAQFDLNGRTYHDYDYTLAGSGPDGTGALASTAQIDAATAYAQNTGFFDCRGPLAGCNHLIRCNRTGSQQLIKRFLVNGRRLRRLGKCRCHQDQHSSECQCRNFQ